ncbi:DUF397 domain-containing protein [Streptomyces sp. NPDC002387]|uniref:DUF397 domain-containing protein n=1 Tax=unclassified Streptomyces TaxID=2593676 RepID=UPI0036B26C91
MSPTELTWFKSSYSGDSSGDCVEVSLCPTTVHVRDSKNTRGPRLTLSTAAWSEFLGFAARGRTAADVRYVY